MSINFCTITNSSVLSFCGNRRGIVLNNLLAQKYPPPPVQGTNNRGTYYTVRKDAVPDVQQRWRTENDDEDLKFLDFEQPIVSVEVEFMGFKGIETQDFSNTQTDFVTVTDFSLNDVTIVQVLDFEVKTDAERTVNTSTFRMR